ncbi:hypothetical protein [Bradyrhizobium sp. NP1]|uniref:hypothetical protein n=1 Tax=Bradyrhizobium sp. NP1 TaxID=3049772 RepID=UPI0025A67534|nr:hypothetical protein [Bradyrhizobium sp. NP1]WJR75264.1 hypothetical protein QOU61_20880 [Bradyrhizobium sp. NP1]
MLAPDTNDAISNSLPKRSSHFNTAQSRGNLPTASAHLNPGDIRRIEAGIRNFFVNVPETSVAATRDGSRCNATKGATSINGALAARSYFGRDTMARVSAFFHFANDLITD